MSWVVRRLLVGFAVGNVVCTILLLVWTVPGSDAAVSVGLRDLAFAGLVILPFQAVGLGVLFQSPCLYVTCRFQGRLIRCFWRSWERRCGTVVVLPISESPYFLELTLPATCGALSALVSFAFNRDAIKQRA